MLRPQEYNIESNHTNGKNPPPQQFLNGVSPGEDRGTGSIDIQEELNRLEEMILSSARIPLFGKTLIDEEKLLDHLDFIRVALPEAFQAAAIIIQQKEEIFLEAEEYGQQIVDAAQAKRAQILDENDIIRQAEQEAAQLRQQVQQECEEMMQETLAEIDRQRRVCQQELEEMQRQAFAEATAIEQGADEYADGVLVNIEHQLQDMMRIIRNGRQQLQQNDQKSGKPHSG
ncbi:MAG: DivIVA domain-containing protein [Calothrix sp. MO_167.B12]|nr:DivIVA domain-containing protein [Calothrix sp. MO_167.B12]